MPRPRASNAFLANSSPIWAPTFSCWAAVIFLSGKLLLSFSRIFPEVSSALRIASICWVPACSCWMVASVSWSGSRAARTSATASDGWESSTSRSPPRKSMPKLFIPRLAKKPIDPPMRIREMKTASTRLPRKLNWWLGAMFAIVRRLRPPTFIIQRKAVRVKRIAEKREAMMPSIRVTENPRTGPLACQKRMPAVMRVVALASKIALKALP